MPLTLTDGDLDEMCEKIQEVTIESWNKIEDCYSALLIGVEQSITKLKILVQTSKQPVLIGQRLQPRRLMETTFGIRIIQILARALQFNSIKVKQQAKGLDHVSMNMEALPIQVLHYLHQGITNELKECKQRNSKLNIHVEQ